ncbi:conserved exported hypothetical protein [Cupriavidus necator]|uniref:Extra-cytoplasmic solute receptor n=1 Tax=Cupriavidus necator TaxID=106590 RepID=A0A1K0INQ7_CUPNE|nr:conserved exported hypothetical protein [Cupriavidus necator]
MIRRFIPRSCCLLSALALLAPAVAAAENYPSHPIKMIVPYPAGGGTDVLVRTVMQEMSKTLGQSIVVINRPGAGGKIGVTAVKLEKPDGYTMVLSSTSTMAVSPAIEPKLSYDPVKSFVHGGMIAKTPGVLLATRSLPAGNLDDLKRLLTAKPDDYVIASGTPTTFLSAEMYKQAIKSKMQTVQYNGSPPLLLDLVPGRVHLTFMIAGAAIPEIKNGTVKALAVTWDKRIPQLPDVPTMKEAGMGQVEATTWVGIAFPAGTPAPVVNKVNAALNHALQQPHVARRLVELGYFAEGGSPEQHSKTVASELTLWSKIYTNAGSPGLQ